jgi:hypothetical protein
MAHNPLHGLLTGGSGFGSAYPWCRAAVHGSGRERLTATGQERRLVRGDQEGIGYGLIPYVAPAS